jgi:hypothetical protein
MIGRSFRRLALAGICLTAIATAPAVLAQQAGVRTELITNGPQFTAGDAAGPVAAQRNQSESGQYEMLLRSNPAFRARRIAKECGPISDPQLHASCVASFGGPGR